MKCLVVAAYPLAESLCAALTRTAVDALIAERHSYYVRPFDSIAVREQIERLLAAEAIVLVFPNWWFGFPAILKDWFDRVWAPGVAYDHASDLGPVKPRLSNLRRAHRTRRRRVALAVPGTLVRAARPRGRAASA